MARKTGIAPRPGKNFGGDASSQSDPSKGRAGAVGPSSSLLGVGPAKNRGTDGDSSAKRSGGPFDAAIAQTDPASGRRGCQRVQAFGGRFLPEGKRFLRTDDPLAQKQFIGPDDLEDKPLIVSEQAMKTGALAHWFGDGIKETDIVATYNLLFNAVQLARVGAGYVLALDKLVSAEEGSGLAFRLLDPSVVSSIDFAWKRDQAMSSAAQKFLEYMRMDDREETK